MLTIVYISLPGPRVPRDPPVSASHLAGGIATLQASAAVSSFYLGLRDSDSGLRAPKSSALFTETSLSQDNYFSTCGFS